MRLIPLGIGVILSTVACEERSDVAPTQERAATQEKTTQESATEQAREAPAPQAAARTQGGTPESQSALAVPGVGVCQPSQQLENMVSQLLSQADADNNQRISKKEAQSLVNFVLGGFFFRADENADGKVTAEEAREARMEFARQNPAVAALLQQAKAVRQTTGERPFVRIAEMMDLDYEQPLSAVDVRSAARAAMDDLYRMTDKNEDGAITLDEARAASLAGARAAGQQAFAAADSDNDGAVELKELEQSVNANLKVAFNAADRNRDGKLTETEAAEAMGAMTQTLGLPAMAPKL